MRNKFVAIGHITDDTEPYHHIGGGVTYSALCAARLGYDAHIVTKCQPDHPYLRELQLLGIHVHLLHSSSQTVTTFSNFYDSRGRRKQLLIEKGEMITTADFNDFPKDILTDAIILVASVIGEVDIQLIPILARYGKVAVTPQGYFRGIKKDGTVYQRSWSGFEEYIKHSNVTILSTEDLPADNASLVKRLITSAPVTVITDGERGSKTYHNGKKIRTNAFLLQQAQINSLTGAGDTFAAMFIIDYLAHNDVKRAGVIASLYTAIKIIGMDGVGIYSVPTLKRVRAFIKGNVRRVENYFKAQKIDLQPNLIFK